MSLQSKISEDVKNALRNQEKLKLSVLRMLLASIKNRIIELKNKELSDEQIVAVIGSEIKKRNSMMSKPLIRWMLWLAWVKGTPGQSYI